MLNILEEYTREFLCVHVDRRINARKFRHIISALIERHGAPEHIRSDNGSEFIEGGLRHWLAENGIRTLYKEPGSPWQKGSSRASTLASERNASTASSFGL